MLDMLFYAPAERLQKRQALQQVSREHRGTIKRMQKRAADIKGDGVFLDVIDLLLYATSVGKDRGCNLW